MIFVHCTKSTQAIGNESFECSIDNNVHYSFKIALNFVKSDEMKKNLTRLNTRQFLKVRKEKQSGAIFRGK